MPANTHKAEAPVYSIVIPALEEAALIVSSLKKVHDFLVSEDMLVDTEVVVVAARGRDNTAELARSQKNNFKHFKLIEPGPKAGKGRDVKAGMLAAKGKYVLFTDADLATPLVHCRKAFDLLQAGEADMVIGVRNLWKAHKGLKRKLISVCANWTVRLFLLPTIPDSQCGFKGFNRQVIDELFGKLTIEGWAFDMELLVIAKNRHLRMKKIFIADWTDPKLGKGLVAGESALKTAVSTFRELLIIWRRKLKGAYK